MDSRIAPTGNTAHGRPGPGPVTPETGQPQAHYQGRSVEPVESDEEMPQLEAIPRRTNAAQGSTASQRKKAAQGSAALQWRPVQKQQTLWDRLLVEHVPDNLGALGLTNALMLHSKIMNSSPLTCLRLSFSEQPFADCLENTVKHWLQSWTLRHELWCSHDQLTIASLWLTRLWEHYKANPGEPTHAQLDAWARDFEQTQLAQLRPHLDFIHRHGTVLRQLFSRNQNRLTSLNNTHLAYVMALQLPEWREMIEKHTGEAPPEPSWKF